jgi:hypothetical protein
MTPHAAEAHDLIKNDLAKAILAEIREDELVAMCCDVVNIPSATGEELEMGRYMRAAFEEIGLAVSWQEVEPGRANVVGLWEGTGNGQSLMFNGHMDTSNTGRETFLTGLGYKAKAIIRHKMIYGLGIYNMKGALVCYMQAVKALMRAGVKLEGDVTIAAVVGEIEKTQWSDEFVGKEFRGYGVGTHHLVNHVYSRKARRQLGVPNERNPRPDLQLDLRVGEKSHLRRPAGSRERRLHSRRFPLARQPHTGSNGYFPRRARSAADAAQRSAYFDQTTRARSAKKTS